VERITTTPPRLYGEIQELPGATKPRELKSIRQLPFRKTGQTRQFIINGFILEHQSQEFNQNHKIYGNLIKL